MAKNLYVATAHLGILAIGVLGLRRRGLVCHGDARRYHLTSAHPFEFSGAYGAIILTY